MVDVITAGSTPGKTIRQREESIDKLKAKVARLKKEREQMENLEREAQRCLKEKVEAEKARTEAEAQLQTITDQLQAFRKGKSEADVIKQQEALLSTLRQELIEAKSRAEKRDALEEECKRKQGENAELKAEIAQLKRELEEKSWNLSVERMRSFPSLFFCHHHLCSCLFSLPLLVGFFSLIL